MYGNKDGYPHYSKDPLQFKIDFYFSLAEDKALVALYRKKLEIIENLNQRKALYFKIIRIERNHEPEALVETLSQYYDEKLEEVSVRNLDEKNIYKCWRDLLESHPDYSEHLARKLLQLVEPDSFDASVVEEFFPNLTKNKE